MAARRTGVTRVATGAVVTLTSFGLVLLGSAPSNAVEADATGPASDGQLTPTVEPDPNTTVVSQGDSAADGTGVRTTAVDASAPTGVRATREGGNVVKIKPTLTPGPAKKYGVAQIVTMRFPVAVNRQKEVERAITIAGYTKGNKAKPVALPIGRWGWVDSRTAVYRPKKFWPGNTTIEFNVNLRGVTVAKQDGKTYEGGAQSEFVHKMRTGRSFVLRIRDSKHQMQVIKGKKVVKTFGVSLGKSKWETRSGIKVLSDIKYRNLRMTGTDRYTGETWDVISPYSMPLTTNGEYIHGAPWARYRIGYANGSHGCTNMNVEDARWLYKRVRAGDPVVTTGTPRKMSEGLAYTEGKPWTHSWKNWKKKSHYFG